MFLPAGTELVTSFVNFLNKKVADVSLLQLRQASTQEAKNSQSSQGPDAANTTGTTARNETNQVVQAAVAAVAAARRATNANEAATASEQMAVSGDREAPKAALPKYVASDILVLSSSVQTNSKRQSQGTCKSADAPVSTQIVALPSPGRLLSLKVNFNNYLDIVDGILDRLHVSEQESDSVSVEHLKALQRKILPFDFNLKPFGRRAVDAKLHVQPGHDPETTTDGQQPPISEIQLNVQSNAHQFDNDLSDLDSDDWQDADSTANDDNISVGSLDDIEHPRQQLQTLARANSEGLQLASVSPSTLRVSNPTTIENTSQGSDDDGNESPSSVVAGTGDVFDIKSITVFVVSMRPRKTKPRKKFRPIPLKRFEVQINPRDFLPSPQCQMATAERDRLPLISDSVDLWDSSQQSCGASLDSNDDNFLWSDNESSPRDRNATANQDRNGVLLSSLSLADLAAHFRQLVSTHLRGSDQASEGSEADSDVPGDWEAQDPRGGSDDEVEETEPLDGNQGLGGFLELSVGPTVNSVNALAAQVPAAQETAQVPAIQEARFSLAMERTLQEITSRVHSHSRFEYQPVHKYIRNGPHSGTSGNLMPASLPQARRQAIYLILCVFSTMTSLCNATTPNLPTVVFCCHCQVLGLLQQLQDTASPNDSTQVPGLEMVEAKCVV